MPACRKALETIDLQRGSNAGLLLARYLKEKQDGERTGNEAREALLDDVVKAVGELYGKEACIPENSMDFFNKLMEFDNLKAVYDDARIYERLNKETLVEISDKHPEWFKGDRDIEALIRRKQKEEPKYIGLQINDNNELIAITTNGNIILQEDANVLKILHDIERNNPDYALDPGTKKAVESYSNKNT